MVLEDFVFVDFDKDGNIMALCRDHEEKPIPILIELGYLLRQYAVYLIRISIF